jgi:RNA polymerase sigma factor for flagellar operon FliA
VAKKLIRQLAKASVDLDDLISAGTLGLIDAATRYDRARIASFKAYAEIRVRGAMLDWLRSMDWLPRSVRASVRREESSAGVVSLEDIGEAACGNDASAQAIAERNETKAQLVAAIASLPKREREVMSLYYVEELTFKEIGEIYSFSEARACQIHSACVARLRMQMKRSAA